MTSSFFHLCSFCPSNMIIYKKDCHTKYLRGSFVIYFLQALIQKLESNKIISHEDWSVYYYGLEILFSTVITTLSILVLSYIVSSISIGVLYLLFTMPLRSTLGGYHAKSYMHCFLLSNFIFFATNILIHLFSTCNFSIYLAYTLLFLSCMYLYCSQPTRNPCHPISDSTLRKNKKNADYFLTAEILLILFFILLDVNTKYILISIFAIVSVAFLKIIVSRKEILS